MSERYLCERCANPLEFWVIEEDQKLCGPCDLFDFLGINRIGGDGGRNRVL